MKSVRKTSGTGNWGIRRGTLAGGGVAAWLVLLAGCHQGAMTKDSLAAEMLEGNAVVGDGARGAGGAGDMLDFFERLEARPRVCSDELVTGVMLVKTGSPGGLDYPQRLAAARAAGAVPRGFDAPALRAMTVEDVAAVVVRSGGAGRDGREGAAADGAVEATGAQSAAALAAHGWSAARRDGEALASGGEVVGALMVLTDAMDGGGISLWKEALNSPGEGERGAVAARGVPMPVNAAAERAGSPGDAGPGIGPKAVLVRTPKEAQAPSMAASGNDAGMPAPTVRAGAATTVPAEVAREVAGSAPAGQPYPELGLAPEESLNRERSTTTVLPPARPSAELVGGGAMNGRGRAPVDVLRTPPAPRAPTVGQMTPVATAPAGAPRNAARLTARWVKGRAVK
ncbi:hypothetical protein BH11PLA1_BH11PLA1_19900 [soil metagenome]